MLRETRDVGDLAKENGANRLHTLLIVSKCMSAGLERTTARFEVQVLGEELLT